MKMYSAWIPKQSKPARRADTNMKMALRLDKCSTVSSLCSEADVNRAVKAVKAQKCQ